MHFFFGLDTFYFIFQKPSWSLCFSERMMTCTLLWHTCNEEFVWLTILKGPQGGWKQKKRKLKKATLYTEIPWRWWMGNLLFVSRQTNSDSRELVTLSLEPLYMSSLYAPIPRYLRQCITFKLVISSISLVHFSMKSKHLRRLGLLTNMPY